MYIKLSITKCIKVLLKSTYFACENVFSKHLIERLLILRWWCWKQSRERKISYITFCQWNLSNLMTHNFINVSLLQTLAVENNCDISSFAETFLVCWTDNDDDRIPIPLYNLLRVEHLSNTKRVGVCIYYNDHLPIIKTSFSMSCYNFDNSWFEC